MEDTQSKDTQKEHDRINLEYRISIMLLDFFERNGYRANYIQVDKGTYQTYWSNQDTLFKCWFKIIDVNYQNISIGTDDIEGIIQKHNQVRDN